MLRIWSTGPIASPRITGFHTGSKLGIPNKRWGQKRDSWRTGLPIARQQQARKYPPESSIALWVLHCQCDSERLSIRLLTEPNLILCLLVIGILLKDYA